MLFRTAGILPRAASVTYVPIAHGIVADWRFRSSANGQMSELLRDESSLMYNLLKPEPVRKLLSEHRRGRQDNHKLLFSLVMVEQWLRGISSQRQVLEAASTR